MNVKKMTSEHLLQTILAIKMDAECIELGQASIDFLGECEKELKRRWGIKG